MIGVCITFFFLSCTFTNTLYIICYTHIYSLFTTIQAYKILGRIIYTDFLSCCVIEHMTEYYALFQLFLPEINSTTAAERGGENNSSSNRGAGQGSDTEKIDFRLVDIIAITTVTVLI